MSDMLVRVQRLLEVCAGEEKIPKELNKQLKKLKEDKETLIDNETLERFTIVWEVQLKKIPNLRNQPETDEGKLIQLLKEVLWNHTDWSEHLCKVFYKNSKTINMIMEDLHYFALKPKDLENDLIRHHIKANFGILHNLLRHNQNNGEHIEADNGLDIIACYTRSDYAIVTAYAFVIQAFCDKPDKTIVTDARIFTFLLNVLNSTLLSSTHMSEDYGLSTEEVVQCLELLARNDKNKISLLNKGVLSHICGILNPNSREIEISRCLDLLWTLYENSKNVLLKNPNLVIKLKEIHTAAESKKFKSKTILKDSSSILHVLELMQPPKHIMISYQWDSQGVVEQLYKYLHARGFPVWIDIKDMKGDIHDSEASGVENAELVIMGVTKKYKASQNCEDEAKYAVKRKVKIFPIMLEKGYKPDGWLGLIMGQKIYVDLHKEGEKFHEKVEKQILALCPQFKSFASG